MRLLMPPTSTLIHEEIEIRRVLQHTLFRMASLLKSVLIVFLLPTIWGQDLTCYSEGVCSRGTFVGVSIAESYNECLGLCNRTEKCNWFTFFENLQDCLEFSDCPGGVQPECQSCFTGEKLCDLKSLCAIQGLCSGSFVGVNFTVTAVECFDLCQMTSECQWFTYEAHSRNCILLESCQEVDETCRACTSGQSSCTQNEVLQCNVDGLCSGDFVDIHDVASDSECLNSCKLDSNCAWYTFNPTTTTCILLRDCESIDKTCDDCSSGMKEC